MNDGHLRGGSRQDHTPLSRELPLPQPQQQQQEWGGLDAVLFSKLPTGPFLRVLELLPAQDRACSGRLACKDAWRHLSLPHHRTAFLSQQLPPHAVPWFERYGPEALKQLPLSERLETPIRAAAASGSTANLAAVWHLVRKGLPHELLQHETYRFAYGAAKAAEVVVQEGHAHLLPWLKEQGFPIDAQSTFLAAARHGDLASLQLTWDICKNQLKPSLDLAWVALEWAAESPSSEDAIRKMEWIMLHLGAWLRPMGRLPPAAAAGAAASGDPVRLRWMLQRGCDFDARREEYRGVLSEDFSILPMAMYTAGLEVIEWLVEEAGCQLPPAAAAAGEVANPRTGDAHARNCTPLANAAAGSGDAAKLRWLRERGLLPLHPQLLASAAERAARGGHLNTLRYLHEECGLGLTAEVAARVVASGNVATADWVLQQGGRGLLGSDQSVWTAAASSGNPDLVRWALEQGVVGTEELGRAAYWLVQCWPGSLSTNGSLLAAAGHLFGTVAGSADSSMGVSSGGAGGGGGGGSDGRAARKPARDINSLHDDSAEQILVYAVRCSGSVPLIAYLHSQLHCPLSPSLLLEAVDVGCEALVEWLINNGCALPGNTLELFKWAVQNGDVFMLRCLRRMGVPWPRGLLPEAVREECPLPMLLWLVAEGVPGDRAAVTTALEVAPFAYRAAVDAWWHSLLG